MGSTSFAEVWEGYKAGDAEAQRRLLAEFIPRIAGLVRKSLWNEALHEDLIQSVFVSVIGKHRTEIAEVRDSNDLWELFAAVTLRHCDKYVKRLVRRPMRSLDAPAASPGADSTPRLDVPAADTSPDEEAAVHDLIATCKSRLTERQRRVLELQLEGRTRNEIRQALQVSIPTIDRELKRVRDVLEELSAED
jgi:RNA polymerase sigma factor (sigma-70 family)